MIEDIYTHLQNIHLHNSRLYFFYELLGIMFLFFLEEAVVKPVVVSLGKKLYVKFYKKPEEPKAIEPECTHSVQDISFIPGDMN
jgi:hypothetical protein